ncbi:MAG: IS110 family transposase [Pseudomonadota bacterium]
MSSKLRYIGLDVHKETIVIAVAEEGRGEARVFKTIPYDLVRLVKAMQFLAPPERMLICYEAGPTGFGVQRALQQAGYACQVVAPSLIPVQSGNRVKTDRRDAKKLAHFLRSGDLTEITTPDEEREALRDLERARDDAKRAENVARQQLSKFLLRRDLRYHDGGAWTKKHLAWIRSLRLEEAAAQIVLQDYLQAVEDATERVDRLTAALEERIYESSLASLTKALMVMRGVALVTAASIAAEIGDFRRFRTAKQFMAYVGLTPAEDSSGQRVRRGRITKCGNRHVRRLLVEAAQHYHRRPNMSQVLRKRNEGQAAAVRAIGWEAQKRLHGRLFALQAKGKSHNKAICAVARELAGFVWAIGQQVSAAGAT